MRQRSRDPLPGHLHPSEKAYAAGCGCEKCMARRRRLRKQRELDGPQMVDSGPMRERVQELIDQGYSVEGLCHALRLVKTTVNDVRDGQPTVHKKTAQTLLDATHLDIINACPDNSKVPMVGAIRRLQALQRMGWSLRMLERPWLDYYRIRGISAHLEQRMIARLHRSVQAVYHELHMTPGPSKQARSKAELRGYFPPLAWDDESIDDPAAVPDGGQLPDESNTRMDLYQQGLSDGQIGAAVGVSTDAIQKWRTRRNLPSNYYTREGRAS